MYPLLTTPGVCMAPPRGSGRQIARLGVGRKKRLHVARRKEVFWRRRGRDNHDTREFGSVVAARVERGVSLPSSYRWRSLLRRGARHTKETENLRIPGGSLSPYTIDCFPLHRARIVLPNDELRAC